MDLFILPGIDVAIEEAQVDPAVVGDEAATGSSASRRKARVSHGGRVLVY